MKNLIAHYFTSFLLLTLFCNNTFAQKSIGGTPYSFSKEFRKDFPNHHLKTKLLNSPDKDQLLLEDQANGITNRYSVHIPVNFTMKNSGKWTELPSGDRLWQLKVFAPNANGLLFTYSDFQLPKEGLLYIYNEEHTHVIGGFSNFNNEDGGGFSTVPVAGETIIFEYYEPREKRNQAILEIDNASFIYVNIDEGIVEEFEKDPTNPVLQYDCHLNVNCPIGNDWRQEQRGVLRMLMFFGNCTTYCSGSLINNTNADKTPYVLSALHCSIVPYWDFGWDAAEYEKFQFFFRYEQNCPTNINPNPSINYPSLTMVGSDYIAGHIDSDFMLLEMFNEIPATPYRPYFNGWNRGSAASPEGTMIHHPAANPKKISVDDDFITIRQNDFTYTYSQSGYVHTFPGNHFWETGFDNGTTEGGSSGAPLFNNLGLIVGQHYGSVVAGCTNPVGLVGRLNHSWWAGNGTDEQLAPWLSPNSNQFTLTGLEGGPAPGCGNLIEWAGEIDALNASTWGASFEFIKKEMDNNVVTLREAYFHNVAEVDQILTEDKPEYFDAQKALRKLIFEGSRSFFKAFVFNMKNKLSEKEIHAFRNFLKELYPLLRSEEIKIEVQKLYTGLDLGIGKDLKAAMIIYDQANLENLMLMPSVGNIVDNQFQITNSLGNVSTFCYEIFEDSQVEIELFDLNGKPIRRLLNEKIGEGKYQIEIQKSNLSQGVYLVCTKIENVNGTIEDVRKMIVMQ